MPWLILIIAGLLEIGWAVGLKHAEGFTRLWPSVYTLVVMVLSMGMLAHAVKTIPLGTAYAIWTGIGAVGTTLVGMMLFDESRDVLRILFIVLIVAAVVGLRLTSSS